MTDENMFNLGVFDEQVKKEPQSADSSISDDVTDKQAQPIKLFSFVEEGESVQPDLPDSMPDKNESATEHNTIDLPEEEATAVQEDESNLLESLISGLSEDKPFPMEESDLPLSQDIGIFDGAFENSDAGTGERIEQLFGNSEDNDPFSGDCLSAAVVKPKAQEKPKSGPVKYKRKIHTNPVVQQAASTPEKVSIPEPEVFPPEQKLYDDYSQGANIRIAVGAPNLRDRRSLAQRIAEEEGRAFPPESRAYNFFSCLARIALFVLIVGIIGCGCVFFTFRSVFKGSSEAYIEQLTEECSENALLRFLPGLFQGQSVGSEENVND